MQSKFQTVGDGYMMTVNTQLCKTLAIAALSLVSTLSLVLNAAQRCDAQTNPPTQTNVALLSDPLPAETARDGGSNNSAAKTAPAPATLDPEISPAVAKQLAAMQAEIEELKAELKRSTAQPIPTAAAPTSAPSSAEKAAEPAALSAPVDAAQSRTGLPEKPAPTQPFAYADWTWLNGNARNKDVVWDSKFFTPEIRLDAHFIEDFNHPRDDTMGGSTEIFRSNELQVEQISFGGNFHWQNVNARILTMNGMFGVTTPRNDASAGRGQWDLRGAYKYVSEANAGYHWDVNHGLNLDAGIFVSYIGLFSYYNFDNWTYQPSYVSSNTPWFFNGVRIQWFPTDKLKIEPWIINGWQSYGRMGSKPGLGGQILYRPKPWLSLVFNNYGMGEDTLGNGDGHFGRSRIHTDDSVEVKYYDRPEKFLDKMAFSLTGDLGCEYGGTGSFVSAQGRTINNNVNCHHNTATSSKQTFAGWMLYNRWWFKKDLYGITLGGGAMANPGRYLTLLPPINGADAITGSPYFTANPGDPYKAWDTSLTFDWMPKQYITFRAEYGYRHANVPYWTGRGGITPGDNLTPSTVPNPAAGSVVGSTTFVPGPFLSATPGFTCVAGSTGFCPDLRKDEPSMRYAIMVKF
ncbi:MAG TPA: outer membrane beta-barrel protein [Candidatus Sulfotelmatobacter sp.]|nr:outer membrane beta-barrel protein [Candidatus Sulfotelmatobacter sp.]